jgi:aspartyl/glutamyl-tRNA(Asn/Gln) amidotransferase C subunit
MISSTDVVNLAELAQITLSEHEQDSLQNDLEDILAYVGEVQRIDTPTGAPHLGAVHNVFREDTDEELSDDAPPDNAPSTYADDFVASLPVRSGRSLQVKKIL